MGNHYIADFTGLEVGQTVTSTSGTGVILANTDILSIDEANDLIVITSGGHTEGAVVFDAGDGGLSFNTNPVITKNIEIYTSQSEELTKFLSLTEIIPQSTSIVNSLLDSLLGMMLLHSSLRTNSSFPNSSTEMLEESILPLQTTLKLTLKDAEEISI